ncbi:MAG: HD domain-containing protein [Ruminococcus sp.]|nr:HD domain-containing protein [Ruminococcus sp.]
MTNKRKLFAVILMLVCIALNYFGRVMSETFDLPVWADSFGTVLSAYAFGPVCGAVVGVIGNGLYGILNDTNALFYTLTSAAIGIIVGLSARKKRFDTLFGTISVSVMVTLVSVIISVPLNLLTMKGRTGNIWGNGVIDYLYERNVPLFLCRVIGQFYVDFLDKVLVLALLYVFIKLFGSLIKNNDSAELSDKAGKAVSVIAAAVVTLSLASSLPVSAKQESSDSMPKAAAVSEYDSYIQTVYSKADGLECGEANDIEQTSDGVLWIGTYAGLYRYAGKEFKIEDEYKTVKNVNRLYVDPKDRLWIGTNDNGLAVAKDEKVIATLDEEGGLSSNSVRSVSQTDDGLYYVGTAGSLMILTMDADNKLTVVGELSDVGTGDCVVTSGFNAACVTAGGTLYLMRDKQILDSLNLGDDEHSFACAQFIGDKLYAGMSDNFVRVYDVSGGKLSQTQTLECGDLSYINEIDKGSDGKVFICADNGVGYFDKEGSFFRINTNSFNNSIDNVEVDYQGNIWLTSSRLGLLKMSASVFTDIFTTYGIENSVVNAVERSDGKMYVGTDKGLKILDENSGELIENKLTQMLDGVRIRCIKTDKGGDLWVSSYGKGLVVCSPGGQIKVFDATDGASGNWARVTAMMSDGTVASAGDTGISFIKDLKITGSIGYGDDFTSSAVLCLLEGDDGDLLAGSDGDGIFFLKDGKVTGHITRNEGLSSGVILRLAKSSDGGIFAVTSNGLCYINKSGEIKTLSSFPYSNNFDLWSDGNGKLFVLGSAGIYVVDEQKLIANDKLSYVKLDAKRGLTASITANSWNYCDDEGRLYISCDTGVLMFDMKNYLSNAESFKMKLTTLRLDKDYVSVNSYEPADIARNVNRIELFPEVINYSIEDPTVSYILEGFDKEPTVLSNSELDSITYTNLPVGNYTFRLKVLDNNGNTIDELSFPIRKQKEIYDNSYFSVYMITVAMLAVAWLTWFIVRRQTQRILERQKAQLELAEKQVQMGNETILAIAKTVDAKDGNTSRHSFRVSEYAVMMAKELGWDKKEIENLRNAALLHDIGKIGIPDSILNKPSRLTDDEYKIMKTHVTKGAEILKDFTLIEHVVDGALYHHERYDGSGYNSGLKGEEIPIYGRLIGVADAFDAMTANRVYRKQLDMGYVRNEFAEGRGKQFDPQMVDVLLKLIDNGTIDVEKLYNKKD